MAITILWTAVLLLGWYICGILFPALRKETVQNAVSGVQFCFRQAVRLAAKEGIPVLLDLVGVSCSKIRMELAMELIEKGKINKKEMKRLRLTISDLLEALRIGGSPSLSSVEYAVMESNGNLSIIQKAQEKPLTPADLSIAKSPESMPLVLISDGNFYPQNLRASGWTETQMDSELLARGVTSRSEVFFAFCDEQSRLHVFLTDSSDVFATEVSR